MVKLIDFEHSQFVLSSGNRELMEKIPESESAPASDRASLDKSYASDMDTEWTSSGED